eukprot:CAMPEP_0206564444 /NCGR_PEP_ID=MMETSP0325_2-20121206/23468_1 /ASSEMBLY_ACC=CAM_ASM_000347 /TAXON_ID=2866 /ORGANISM="Crypthecodinium cohnii, Strain Seligo" /LENGTH=429 /DNA_ID=CAMNT_0054067087 /DNA_START=225 /DNA_END=1511 /DNA_ORIENTATION=-
MWLKVKDGIFLGGEEAAGDLQSLLDSKVARVINCCGSEVGNRWESFGVTYLTYNWEDDNDQIILDAGDFVVNDICDFIDGALAKEECVLVHSRYGESRSCCVLLAYFMRKFKWSLQKSKDFLIMRQASIQMSQGFQEQLATFEARLSETVGPLSTTWEASDMKGLSLAVDDEALLLTNTYLNTTKLKEVMPESSPSAGSRESPRRRVIWSDQGFDETGLLEYPFTEEEVAELRGKSGDTPRRAAPSALRGASPRTPNTSPTSAADGDSPTFMPRTNRVSLKTSDKGVLTCRPDEIVAKRFGLQLKKRRIILEYEVPLYSVTAHHIIAVDLDRLVRTLPGRNIPTNGNPESSASAANGTSTSSSALRIGQSAPSSTNAGSSDPNLFVPIDHEECCMLASTLLREHFPWLRVVAPMQVANLVRRIADDWAE